MLSVNMSGNHFLRPEDAERPKAPLPPPPRLVKRRSNRPSSPVVLMKAEKLPKSLPPIGTMRSTSPKLTRKRGSPSPVPLTPPPSAASRMGFSQSHCQLSLISENEDDDEPGEGQDDSTTGRGATSCPNSPLMGRRHSPMQKSSFFTPAAFDRTWKLNATKCGTERFNNNNETKNEKNEQNKKTNNSGRKFVLPEIIVQ